MSRTEKTLEALLVSKVRIKVLKFFVMNPNSKLHLRAIVRDIEEEINAVRRELARLEEVGIVRSEETLAKKFFEVNKESVFYNEFLLIFHKTYGLGGEIISSASQIGKVKYAILTDDYLKQQHTGGQKIDLVVVGEINLDSLNTIIEEVEKTLKQEIYFTVFTEKDFYLKKKRRDPFILNMIIKRHVLLIGDHDELIS